MQGTAATSADSQIPGTADSGESAVPSHLGVDVTGLPQRWHTGGSPVGAGYLPRLRNAPFRAYQSA
jgi:hypothetical protein